MRALVLMFALLASAAGLCARTATIYSENRRYWVVIEYNESHDAVAQAALHGPENGRTRVLWKKEYDDLPTDYKNSVIVANDGKFFAVVAFDQIKLFTQNGEKDITEKIENRDLISNELVAGVAMLNGRESVRFWSLGKNGWRAVTLPDVKEISVGPDLQKKWNEITRDEILARFETYEQQRMRARLKEAAPFAGRAIEQISPEQPNIRIGPLEAVFVAMLHDPRDRAFFERMLKKPKRGREETGYFAGSGNNPDGIFWVGAQDDMREHGDQLLAIYEGKVKPSEDGEFDDEEIGKRYYLGSVQGKIQLPTPMIKKPGIIRVYLVPESEKNGKWWKSDNAEEVAQPLPESKAMSADFDHVVAYGFGTVSPGKYFLKAIWDKRPPLTDREAAGPGDYESDWFGPFELAAGASVTNPIVRCAGRAKGGSEYYAADEQALRAWKAQLAAGR